jgi:hypothetical protein
MNRRRIQISAKMGIILCLSVFFSGYLLTSASTGGYKGYFLEQQGRVHI